MTLSRRRVLSISAGLAGAGLGSRFLPVGESRSEIFEWRGIALGAETSIKIAHNDRETAVGLLAAARDEVDRLEDIFSLYRPHSDVSRLNAGGRIEDPAPELVSCLAQARQTSLATGGAFDVTVAPLWTALSDPATSDEYQAEAQARVGFENLVIDPAAVEFKRPHMAVTLNGIAQGYITDRVTNLLEDSGLPGALICLGETRALGKPQAGSPWNVELETGQGRPLHLALETGAIATSCSDATILNRATGQGHLVNPAGADLPPRWRQVTVVARSATQADALSTGLTFVEEDAWRGILMHTRAIRAIGLTLENEIVDIKRSGSRETESSRI